jgi:hypothetical protein
MKTQNRFISIITILLVLSFLLLSGCASSSNEDDKIVMGGTFRLADGETIDGNLSVFGGAVNLEKGSTINGEVTIIGGSVISSGTINGGVNGLGGSISLTDTAVVQGDVTTIGASVIKSNDAKIHGRVTSQSEGGVQIPDIPRVVAPTLLKPFGDVLGGLLNSLVVGVLAVLVVLFLPRQTSNIGAAITGSPVTAGAIGLLTLMLFPIVILLLILTLCLIPIGLAGLIVMSFGMLFGWIAIGLELGKRIAVLFKADWAPAVNAGLGTFILTILTSLFGAIACVGWVVPTLVILLASGGVVMTVFGTRSSDNYPSARRPEPPSTNFPPEPVISIYEKSGPEEAQPAKDQVVDTIFEQEIPQSSVNNDEIDEEPKTESKPQKRVKKVKQDDSPLNDQN